MNPVEKAIDMVGLKNLAEKMGVKRQLLQKWRKRGYVPHCRASAVEEATDGAVQRHEMYPDLFAGYRPVKRRRRKKPENRDE